MTALPDLALESVPPGELADRTPAEPLVTVSGLGVSFGSVRALDGVDLTIMKGGHIDPSKYMVDLDRAFQTFQDAGIEVPIVTTSFSISEWEWARRSTSWCACCSN